MSGHFLAGYVPWIHTSLPAIISTPSPYCKADFPAYLWDAKAFPFTASPFWGDAEVGAVDQHEAVIAHVVIKTSLIVDLLLGERRMTVT